MSATKPEARKQSILRGSAEARQAFALTFQRIVAELQSREPRHHALPPDPPLDSDDAYTATLKGLSDLYFHELNTRLPKRIIVALCECAMYENAQLLAEQAKLRREAEQCNP